MSAATHDSGAGATGDYYCEVCDVKMNAFATYESHCSGKKHIKNLQKNTGKANQADDEPPPIKAKIEDALDEITEPIIGLYKLTETQYPDSTIHPSYFCHLCRTQLGIMGVVDHVTSTKHRLNYIKENDPDGHIIMESMRESKVPLDGIAQERAVTLEEIHGRGKVEVKVEKSKFGYLASMRKRRQDDNEGSPQKKSNNDGFRLNNHLLNMAKCSFQSDWTNNPKFNWLREVPNDKRMAFCILCNIKFSLSNMGLRAVTSHGNGKKHQLRGKSAITSHSVQNIFLAKNAAASSESSETRPISDTIISPVTNEFQAEAQSLAASNSDLLTSQPQKCINGKEPQLSSGIGKYLLKDDVTRAEVLWSLEAIMTHKSLRSAEQDVKLFPKLFPDSQIAKSMQLGRDKMAYTIVYGISPFFKQNLIEELLSCTHYVIGFDESLNKISQKQQMDVNVRFWCPKVNEVKARYLNSAFLGRTRSCDLLASFKEATQPLDLKKLLQISMDGPNVNKKFFRELSDFTKEIPEDPEILNMGSCGLHAINIAFKTGAVSTNWNIMEFHRALYYLFKDSPARRSLFTYYTNSDVFPRKFCFVRWLENSSVAERSLSMIPHVKRFIDGIEKDKVAPTSKSYFVVKNALKDQLLSAKLAFFHLVATEIEPFLREYQTDVPLIPFLYNDLSSIMRQLMGRFVKKEALAKNSVMEVDLNDPSNLLPFKDIDIGISTQFTLKKAKITDGAILFRSECRSFMLKCTNKLKERSPLIYELTKAVSCLDPKVSLSENLFSKRLTKLLLILCQKNWMSVTAADRAKMQLKEICSQPHIISKLKSYKRSQRIDHFWFNILSSEQKSYDDAIHVIKMVMILSHGNANVERGFSINTDCLWDNMKEETLVARRIVYDGILAKGGLDNFEISKQILLHARNARAKFSEAAESRRKEDKEKAMLNKMKREAELEVKKLEVKKAKILEDAQKKSGEIEGEIAALRLLQKKA